MDGEFQAQPWDRPISKEKTELEYGDPHIFTHPLGTTASEIAAAWDAGILPASGALLDQPARVVALVRTWKWACEVCRRHLDARKGAS